MALLPLTRGDDDYLYPTATRTTPALDLTTALNVTLFARRRGSSTLLFQKSIGSGVTVTSASTATIKIDSADTSSLSGGSHWTLDLELEVVEADGFRSTPWRDSITVNEDLGSA